MRCFFLLLCLLCISLCLYHVNPKHCQNCTKNGCTTNIIAKICKTNETVLNNPNLHSTGFKPICIYKENIATDNELLQEGTLLKCICKNSRYNCSVVTNETFFEDLSPSNLTQTIFNHSLVVSSVLSNLTNFTDITNLSNTITDSTTANSNKQEEPSKLILKEILHENTFQDKRIIGPIHFRKENKFPTSIPIDWNLLISSHDKLSSNPWYLNYAENNNTEIATNILDSGVLLITESTTTIKPLTTTTEIVWGSWTQWKLSDMNLYGPLEITTTVLEAGLSTQDNSNEDDSTNTLKRKKRNPKGTIDHIRWSRPKSNTTNTSKIFADPKLNHFIGALFKSTSSSNSTLKSTSTDFLDLFLNNSQTTTTETVNFSALFSMTTPWFGYSWLSRPPHLTKLPDQISPKTINTKSTDGVKNHTSTTIHPDSRISSSINALFKMGSSSEPTTFYLSRNYSGISDILKTLPTSQVSTTHDYLQDSVNLTILKASGNITKMNGSLWYTDIPDRESTTNVLDGTLPSSYWEDPKVTHESTEKINIIFNNSQFFNTSEFANNDTDLESQILQEPLTRNDLRYREPRSSSLRMSKQRRTNRKLSRHLLAESKLNRSIGNLFTTTLLPLNGTTKSTTSEYLPFWNILTNSTTTTTKKPTFNVNFLFTNSSDALDKMLHTLPTSTQTTPYEYLNESVNWELLMTSGKVTTPWYVNTPSSKEPTECTTSILDKVFVNPLSINCSNNDNTTIKPNSTKSSVNTLFDTLFDTKLLPTNSSLNVSTSLISTTISTINESLTNSQDILQALPTAAMMPPNYLKESINWNFLTGNKKNQILPNNNFDGSLDNFIVTSNLSDPKDYSFEFMYDNSSDLFMNTDFSTPFSNSKSEINDSILSTRLFRSLRSPNIFDSLPELNFSVRFPESESEPKDIKKSLDLLNSMLITLPPIRVKTTKSLLKKFVDWDLLMTSSTETTPWYLSVAKPKELTTQTIFLPNPLSVQSKSNFPDNFNLTNSFFSLPIPKSLASSTTNTYTVKRDIESEFSLPLPVNDVITGLKLTSRLKEKSPKISLRESRINQMLGDLFVTTTTVKPSFSYTKVSESELNKYINNLFSGNSILLNNTNILTEMEMKTTKNFPLEVTTENDDILKASIPISKITPKNPLDMTIDSHLKDKNIFQAEISAQTPTRLHLNKISDPRAEYKNMFEAISSTTRRSHTKTSLHVDKNIGPSFNDPRGEYNNFFEAISSTTRRSHTKTSLPSDKNIGPSFSDPRGEAKNIFEAISSTTRRSHTKTNLRVDKNNSPSFSDPRGESKNIYEAISSTTRRSHTKTSLPSDTNIGPSFSDPRGEYKDIFEAISSTTRRSHTKTSLPSDTNIGPSFSDPHGEYKDILEAISSTTRRSHTKTSLRVDKNNSPSFSDPHGEYKDILEPISSTTRRSHTKTSLPSDTNIGPSFSDPRGEYKDISEAISSTTGRSHTKTSLPLNSSLKSVISTIATTDVSLNAPSESSISTIPTKFLSTQPTISSTLKPTTRKFKNKPTDYVVNESQLNKFSTTDGTTMTNSSVSTSKSFDTTTATEYPNVLQYTSTAKSNIGYTARNNITTSLYWVYFMASSNVANVVPPNKIFPNLFVPESINNSSNSSVTNIINETEFVNMKLPDSFLATSTEATREYFRNNLEPSTTFDYSINFNIFEKSTEASRTTTFPRKHHLHHSRKNRLRNYSKHRNVSSDDVSMKFKNVINPRYKPSSIIEYSYTPSADELSKFENVIRSKYNNYVSGLSKFENIDSSRHNNPILSNLERSDVSQNDMTSKPDNLVTPRHDDVTSKLNNVYNDLSSNSERNYLSPPDVSLKFENVGLRHNNLPSNLEQVRPADVSLKPEAMAGSTDNNLPSNSATLKLENVVTSSPIPSNLEHSYLSPTEHSYISPADISTNVVHNNVSHSNILNWKLPKLHNKNHKALKHKYLFSSDSDLSLNKEPKKSESMVNGTFSNGSNPLNWKLPKLVNTNHTSIKQKYLFSEHRNTTPNKVFEYIENFGSNPLTWKIPKLNINNHTAVKHKYLFTSSSEPYPTINPNKIDYVSESHISAVPLKLHYKNQTGINFLLTKKENSRRIRRNIQEYEPVLMLSTLSATLVTITNTSFQFEKVTEKPCCCQTHISNSNDLVKRSPNFSLFLQNRTNLSSINITKNVSVTPTDSISNWLLPFYRAKESTTSKPIINPDLKKQLLSSLTKLLPIIIVTAPFKKDFNSTITKQPLNISQSTVLPTFYSLTDSTTSKFSIQKISTKEVPLNYGLIKIPVSLIIQNLGFRIKKNEDPLPLSINTPKEALKSSSFRRPQSQQMFLNKLDSSSLIFPTSYPLIGTSTLHDYSKLIATIKTTKPIILNSSPSWLDILSIIIERTTPSPLNILTIKNRAKATISKRHKIKPKSTTPKTTVTTKPTKYNTLKKKYFPNTEKITELYHSTDFGRLKTTTSKLTSTQTKTSISFPVSSTKRTISKKSYVSTTKKLTTKSNSTAISISSNIARLNYSYNFLDMVSTTNPNSSLEFTTKQSNFSTTTTSTTPIKMLTKFKVFSALDWSELDSVDTLSKIWIPTEPTVPNIKKERTFSSLNWYSPNTNNTSYLNIYSTVSVIVYNNPISSYDFPTNSSFINNHYWIPIFSKYSKSTKPTYTQKMQPTPSSTVETKTIPTTTLSINVSKIIQQKTYENTKKMHSTSSFYDDRKTTQTTFYNSTKKQQPTSKNTGWITPTRNIAMSFLQRRILPEDTTLDTDCGYFDWMLTYPLTEKPRLSNVQTSNRKSLESPTTKAVEPKGTKPFDSSILLPSHVTEKIITTSTKREPITQTTSAYFPFIRKSFSNPLPESKPEKNLDYYFQDWVTVNPSPTLPSTTVRNVYTNNYPKKSKTTYNYDSSSNWFSRAFRISPSSSYIDPFSTLPPSSIWNSQKNNIRLSVFPTWYLPQENGYSTSTTISTTTTHTTTTTCVTTTTASSTTSSNPELTWLTTESLPEWLTAKYSEANSLTTRRRPVKRVTPQKPLRPKVATTWMKIKSPKRTRPLWVLVSGVPSDPPFAYKVHRRYKRKNALRRNNVVTKKKGASFKEKVMLMSLLL